MLYYSTRNQNEKVTESIALLNGIAPDGGLYIPAEQITPIALKQTDSFVDILRHLLNLFFGSLPESVREDSLKMFQSRFPADAVPFITFKNLTFLELFQGPTGAFKDVALTMLPKLLQYAAKEQGQSKVLILTATSGDTGSAAMSGFSDIEGINVMVFYPQIGTSLIQKKQMTCQAANNVSAVAIKGHFDDAQQAVKHIFTNSNIRALSVSKGVWLSSANSINIGRLFPQISYYLYLGQHLSPKIVDVVVPTGNFGNILAAYFAKKMGANLGKLIVASNENCAVSEFIKTGIYNAKRPFKITQSPSMDILISSNVERLLYYLVNGDTHRVCELMNTLKTEGSFSLSPQEHAQLQLDFQAECATDKESLQAISKIYAQENYLMDPHTAIGYAVAEKLNLFQGENQVAIASTASPWKFPSSCLQALNQPVTNNSFEDLHALAQITGKISRFSELESALEKHTRVSSLNALNELVCSQF